MGAFTAADVMLTMRPNLRAIIPSTVARMSSIGVSMLASSARIHVVAVEVAEVAGRRSAGVGDEDVRIRARGERRRASLGCGDVAGEPRHRPPGQRADLGGGALDVGRGPREDRDLRALARQRLGAAAAQSLARRAHERAAAGDAKIHVV